MNRKEWFDKLSNSPNALNNLAYIYSIDKRIVNGITKDAKTGEKIYLAEEIKEYEKMLEDSKIKTILNILKDKEVFEKAKSASFVYNLFKNERYEEPTENISDDKLTEQRIIDLEEIELQGDERIKNYIDAVKNENCNGIISKLSNAYTSYYDEMPPKGVLAKNGQIFKIVNKSEDKSIYKIIREKNGDRIDTSLKNFYKMVGQKIKNITKENDEDYEAITKETIEKYSYFPKFHLALSTGVKGLYRPLTEWLIKMGLEKIVKRSELELFLSEHIPYLLYTLLNKKDHFIEEELGEGLKQIQLNQEGELKLKEYEEILTTSIMVDDYIPNLIFKTRILSSKQKEFSDEENGKGKSVNKEFLNELAGKVFDSGCEIQKNFQNNNFTRTIYFATEENWNAYKALPSWAYRISDGLRQKGGAGWNNIPIGKTEDEKQVTMNLSGNQQWWLTLVAGSGSGKGVTTMSIIGQAIAQGFPFIYLDCKPDMSKNFYDWGEKAKGNGKNKTIAIDGNENNYFKNYTLNVDGEEKNCFQYLKEKVTEKLLLDKDKDEAFINKLTCALMWTRCIELMINIAFVRAKFNDARSEENKIKAFYEEYGMESEEDRKLLKDITNKKIHPLLIMDEFQAQSVNLAELIETGNDKEVIVEIDNNGKPKTKQVPITAQLTQIRLNNANNDTLNETIKDMESWLKNIYGTGDGVRGQLMTAFGRQSDCNFFTIAQNLPAADSKAKDDVNYGGIMGAVTRAYFKKYPKLLGKGTDTGEVNGTLKYNIRGQGQGEFAYIDEQIKEKVKTYFVLNGAFDSELHPTNKYTGVVKGMSNDARKLTNEEVLSVVINGKRIPCSDEENSEAIVTEKRIDFVSYINDITRKEDEEVNNDLFYENLNKSYDYFNAATQLLYGEEFWHRICNVDDFSLANGKVKYKYKNLEKNKTLKMASQYALKEYLTRKDMTEEEYEDMLEKETEEDAKKREEELSTIYNDILDGKITVEEINENEEKADEEERKYFGQEKKDEETTINGKETLKHYIERTFPIKKMTDSMNSRIEELKNNFDAVFKRAEEQGIEVFDKKGLPIADDWYDWEEDNEFGGEIRNKLRKAFVEKLENENAQEQAEAELAGLFTIERYIANLPTKKEALDTIDKIFAKEVAHLMIALGMQSGDEAEGEAAILAGIMKDDVLTENEYSGVSQSDVEGADVFGADEDNLAQQPEEVENEEGEDTETEDTQEEQEEIRPNFEEPKKQINYEKVNTIFTTIPSSNDNTILATPTGYEISFGAVGNLEKAEMTRENAEGFRTIIAHIDRNSKNKIVKLKKDEKKGFFKMFEKGMEDLLIQKLENTYIKRGKINRYKTIETVIIKGQTIVFEEPDANTTKKAKKTTTIDCTPIIGSQELADVFNYNWLSTKFKKLRNLGLTRPVYKAIKNTDARMKETDTVVEFATMLFNDIKTLNYLIIKNEEKSDKGVKIARKDFAVNKKKMLYLDGEPKQVLVKSVFARQDKEEAFMQKADLALKKANSSGILGEYSTSEKKAFFNGYNGNKDLERLYVNKRQIRKTPFAVALFDKIGSILKYGFGILKRKKKE